MEKLTDVLLTVLLVEDDQDVLDTISLLISSLNSPIKVLTATNGLEGLIRIGQASPDIIVTDLSMPHMDGFAMIRSISENPELQNTDIVAISALPQSTIDENHLLPKTISVLNKPIDFTILESLFSRKIAEKVGKMIETYG